MNTDTSLSPSAAPPSQRLDGRRIVITGAASGIGKATARLFASAGASLSLIDHNLEGLSNFTGTTGIGTYKADVTDEQAIAHAVTQGADIMGGIDGVVNCAGIAIDGSVLEVDIAQWRRVLDVNLTGAYIVVRACLPWLQKATGATIVNVGSGQSLLPNAPRRTAYASSKGGVLNLTRALAAELAPAIRANTVCPGLVDTPMATGMHANARNYALKRLAQPDEIARAILFLTSPDSSYVTGAALAVDGGRSFH